MNKTIKRAIAEHPWITFTLSPLGFVMRCLACGAREDLTERPNEGERFLSFHATCGQKVPDPGRKAAN